MMSAIQLWFRSRTALLVVFVVCSTFQLGNTTTATTTTTSFVTPTKATETFHKLCINTNTLCGIRQYAYDTYPLRRKKQELNLIPSSFSFYPPPPLLPLLRRHTSIDWIQHHHHHHGPTIQKIHPTIPILQLASTNNQDHESYSNNESTTPSTSSNTNNNGNNNNNNNNLKRFQTTLHKMSLPHQTQTTILSDIKAMGFTSSAEIYNFARDFEHRPEVLSSVVREDFGMGEYGPLRSHQIRAAVLRLVKSWPVEEGDGDRGGSSGGDGGVVLVGEGGRREGDDGVFEAAKKTKKSSTRSSTSGIGEERKSMSLPLDSIQNTIQQLQPQPRRQQVPFKSVVVNQKAKDRRTDSSSSSSTTSTSTSNTIPTKKEE